MLIKDLLEKHQSESAREVLSAVAECHFLKICGNKDSSTKDPKHDGPEVSIAFEAVRLVHENKHHLRQDKAKHGKLG